MATQLVTRSYVETMSNQVKKTAKAARPPFKEMVMSAVRNRSDKKGCSRPKIKAYLESEYGVDEKKIKTFLKPTLKKLTDDGSLVRSKSGSHTFKINKAKLEAKKATKKKTDTQAAAKKKKPAAAKKPAKDSTKKAAVKKPAAKKSTVKKSTVKKAAVAKKTPKKQAAKKPAARKTPKKAVKKPAKKTAAAKKK